MERLEIHAACRARHRPRVDPAWLHNLFLVAVLVPCLLAARPAVRESGPILPHAASADAQLATPCDAATDATPRLVIHVEACRFELFDACGRMLRRGPCSTGSGSTLKAPDGRRWTFRTPRGTRRVHHKAPQPVWYKPDWAYVEDNLPVPPPEAKTRYVRGMLGAYALDIGDGYLVHGSPYRTGIGTKTTHGCVRMLEDDLALVYATLRIGDPVILE